MSLPCIHAIFFVVFCLVGCANTQNGANDQNIAAPLVGNWYRVSSIGMRIFTRGDHAYEIESHILTHRKPDGSLNKISRSFTNGVRGADRRYVGTWQRAGEVYLERGEFSDDCKSESAAQAIFTPLTCEPTTFEYQSRIRELSPTVVHYIGLGAQPDRRVEATFELPKDAQLKRPNE